MQQEDAHNEGPRGDAVILRRPPRRHREHRDACGRWASRAQPYPRESPEQMRRGDAHPLRIDEGLVSGRAPVAATSLTRDAGKPRTAAVPLDNGAPRTGQGPRRKITQGECMAGAKRTSGKARRRGGPKATSAPDPGDGGNLVVLSERRRTTPTERSKRKQAERRFFAFLDAAAELFAGSPGRVDKSSTWAITMPPTLDADRRFAMNACIVLAQRYRPSGPSAVQRLRFDELRAAHVRATGKGNLGAAYTVAAALVAQHAKALSNARELYPVEPGEDAANYVALAFIQDFVLTVDPKFLHLANTDGLAFVLDLLRRFDPRAKGKRGKVTATGVLARLCHRTGAFGHTKRRTVEGILHTIDNALTHHRERAR